MEIYCTRPGCKRPRNLFADLDDQNTLKTVQQKFCITCGMPLILLGRYLPLNLLARGGFGAAFLARDRYTPGMRKCVVKQFQPTTSDPEQLTIAKGLFYREGEVLEELGSHPQIPDLLAFFELPVVGQKPGEQDNFFYLAQEYIDGQTLEEELVQKGPFKEAEVEQVLQSVLPVLMFVHESGAVHRDIKLSNIMRPKPKIPGAEVKLYLLDFGAVKQVAHLPAGSVAPATGIYTPFFAPPEQIHGEQVFPCSDLYSLAVTCIALLTGKPPAELYDAYSNRWQWRSHLPSPGVKDTFAQLLDRMLMPAPNQRFQSAEEVLIALSVNLTLPTPVSSIPVTPAPVSMSSASPAVFVVPNPVMASAPLSSSQSLWALLVGSGLTGFSSGLWAIALTSFLGTTYVSGGMWLILLVVLIFSQWQRLLHRSHLLGITALSAGLVIMLPSLQAGQSWLGILLLSILLSLLSMVVSLLFRLIYKGLSSWF